MKSSSEVHTTANGVTIETGTIEHNGRTFRATGSIIDTLGGFVAAYVTDGDTDPQCAVNYPGRYRLTRWDGTLIAPLRLVRRWRSYGCFGGVPCTMFAWNCIIDGTRYSGRNAGPGLFIRMRAKVQR